MKNIILLAPTGQVGFELNRHLQPLGRVISIGRKDADFNDTNALYDVINKFNPDIIVNAAAYTAVDKAESDSENAYAINRDLPKMLATLSNKHDAWLIHYSTDYVYPGNGDKLWQESSPTGPLNTYGQSKLEGDNAIEDIAKKFLILRTSWVYAARGSNFLLSMLKLGSERESLNIVNDQIGAPTSARLIATASTICLKHILLAEDNKAHGSANKFSGVYHLASRGHTSWYGFAEFIFKEARKNGVDLALNMTGLGGIPTESYPTPAIRPKNSRLDLTKIESTFNLIMPSWQSQVALTIEETLN